VAVPAIYCAFLLVAIAALYGRYQGVLSRTRPRIVLNVLAVAWLAFETVNVAWPRTSVAPLDAPFYQVWAAPMVVGVIAVAGLAYLFTARPTDGR
jgi:hypothetical protein